MGPGNSRFGGLEGSGRLQRRLALLAPEQAGQGLRVTSARIAPTVKRDSNGDSK